MQPRHGWLIANLIGQIAFGMLAMTICLPSMQDWPATFSASQASVQLTFSGFVAAYGGMQLVYGAASDRVGRKPILLAGLALGCLGSLLAALAPSLAVLTAARVLQGAGAAAGMVTGRAMVQDLFTGRERVRMMAFVGMTMGMAPPLAMVVGGQIHVRLGWQANFVLVTVLGVSLLLAAWRGLPAVKPVVDTQTSAWKALVGGYGQLLRMPAFVLHVVMLASTTSTFYTFLGGAPLVFKGYGITPEHVGWYVMCIPLSYMAGNILTTRLIRRRGDRFIMVWGQALTVAGLVLVLVLAAAGWHTPLALTLPLLFFGVGHGLLAPPTLTGTVGLLPALAGSAAAVAGLVQQMTGALGGLVVGLVPHHGSVNLGLMMLGWTLCGVVAQVVLFKVVQKKK